MNAKPRILYLCGDTSLIGGIEKYNRDFLSALESTGASVRSVQRKRGGLRSKIIFLFRSLVSILTFKPGYIVCAHLNFSPIAVWANRLGRIPYSVSLYGIEAINISKPIHRIAVGMAKKVIVISQYTKALVARQFAFGDDKYFMLSSSVNESENLLIEDVGALKEKYGFGDAAVVLTLSRLSTGEEKGQHRVLKAFAEVLKEFPTAIYVMAGPGTDRRVEEILEGEPELAASVVRLGAVTDAQRGELYNLCDVFVLPSKNEGFGIVFIEALACGAPVIASDGFGCREGLLNGQLGSVVDPDDVPQLASEISGVLRRAPMRDVVERRRTRSASLAVYGYRAWCEKVAKLVEEIAAR